MSTGFSRGIGCVPDSTDGVLLIPRPRLPLLGPMPLCGGPSPVKKKRELFLAQPFPSPASTRVAARSPDSGAETLCPLPSRTIELNLGTNSKTYGLLNIKLNSPLILKIRWTPKSHPPFYWDFSRCLGLANPHSNAVHEETCPTPVLKVTHLNNCYYHQDLH